LECNLLSLSGKRLPEQKSQIIESGSCILSAALLTFSTNPPTPAGKFSFENLPGVNISEISILLFATSGSDLEAFIDQPFLEPFP